MKKYLFTILTLAFISSAAFADSSIELCAAEAKSAGIVDTAKLNEYVSNCVEKADTSAENEEDSTAVDRSKTEKGMAAVD